MEISCTPGLPLGECRKIAYDLYSQGYRSEHVSDIILLGYTENDAITIGEMLGIIETGRKQ